MKKLFFFLWGLALLSNCVGRASRIDKAYDGGVEIVLNHLEPYRVKGQPSTFSLQETLVIDLERADLAEAGLMSGGEWDTDAQGNISVVGFKNTEDFIFRFDRLGRLLGSFGKRGQGPGELQWPFFSGVSSDGRTAVTDFGVKYIVFDRNGAVLREDRLGRRTTRLEALGNGGYLAWRPQPASGDSVVDVLSLCDNEFADLKELDRSVRPLDDSRQVPFFMWRVSGDWIIVANESRGYELWVYDLGGNLVRKIRKEFRPVRVTKEIKEAILGSSDRRVASAQSRYFPDPLPPLNQFFTDDKGQVFVMTYEPGPAQGEYMWDIFSADGIFVGRKALSLLWAGLYAGPHYTFIKNGYLYFHRIKETGYHELVVSKVTWK